MSPRADGPPASFEEAYQELQRVVARLEDGSLPLEETVHLFERGTELARACLSIVDAAELRVTRLAAETATPLSDAPGPEA